MHAPPLAYSTVLGHLRALEEEVVRVSSSRSCSLLPLSRTVTQNSKTLS